MSDSTRSLPSPDTLRELCDHIPNATVYQSVQRPDRSVQFTYLSAGFERMAGLTREQVLADSTALASRIPTEDLVGLMAAIESAIQSGQMVDHVYRQKDANSELRWVHSRSFPTRQPDGTVVWDGILLDITEERRLGQTLSESEERFRSFMDHSPAIAWIKDEAGRYVYLSRPLLTRFRIKPTDWLGKTDYDLWPAEVAQQLQANDQRAIATNQPIQTIETTPGSDGSPITWWLSFKFPITDAAGRRFAGGMAVDVTEGERLQIELRRKNEELQEALNRVRRLESSLVTMCAWTRTVRLDGKWVSIEEFLRARFGIEVSHGISDDALRQMTAEGFGTDPNPPT